MTAISAAQRRLLTEAVKVGLKKSPTGQARCPPYSRIALNALMDKGLIDLEWRPTAAGIKIVEGATQ